MKSQVCFEINDCQDFEQLQFDFYEKYRGVVSCNLCQLHSSAKLANLFGLTKKKYKTGFFQINMVVALLFNFL